nr:immunoglobulin heavy chain junction region [Macaca mulatta]MOV36045.1 immunoglobulin heavy chain junction region [Macaca mulatta]MOV36308.1 immunoglobulin heavy chain junction region [Macaca mulatta]MOV36351.1 immunoglobulin heavy chain junction region [Macaca mulatta]MOV36491.1 immunoglobulin heavy chain junction region [Macaca mulatta]
CARDTSGSGFDFW